MKNLIMLFFLLLSSLINGQDKMHITEQLLITTIKIQVEKKGIPYNGSGFFFSFKDPKDDKKELVVIITNRHVVDGASSISLYFRKNINGSPEYGKPIIITIPNNPAHVLAHPNKAVDLVAIPIGEFRKELEKKGINLSGLNLNEKLIIDNSTMKKEFKAIERVWMVGYPDGLWDEKNNLPIVREGITATMPYIDYNGKSEFLVDIAAFGGSSGSPVFFYRDFYTDKETNMGKFGMRLYLLGILYAGPMYSLDGEVVKVDPSDPVTNVKTYTPMNLGYVIKATEILEFRKLFPK